MALKVKNCTAQALPVIIPAPNGGIEVMIQSGETIIIAIDKPTPQLQTLKNLGLIKIK